MSYFLFLLISVIWGSNFILMKKAALCFGPISIGGWRVFGGAAVLALIWWWKNPRWPFQRVHLVPVCVLVLVGYSWPFSILPWLVARHGSAFMGILISLVPLLTVVVSVPMLRVFPSRRQLAGMMGALVFLVLIMADGLKRELPVSDLLMGLTVPLCYAIANTYLKRQFAGIPALPLSCTALALASLLLMPLALALPSEQVTVNENFAFATSCLVLSSVLATGISTHIFYKLIQDHGPLFAGMTAYLIPLGAVVWGWLDREELSWQQFASLLGILAMVALVQTDLFKAHARPPSQEPTQAR